MTTEKKSHPTEATAGRAVLEAEAWQATASCCDFTTPAAWPSSFRVADLLMPRQHNAIPRRDLMSLTGYSDRELRLRIKSERRRGIPICSDNRRGYYLAADKAELRRFVNSMLHRAGEISKTAAALEQAEV